MNPLPAVIMDDEKPACDRLFKILSDFPQVVVKGVFTGTKEGLDFIKNHKPRLLFLDIEMENGITAFDIINELGRHCCRPVIILVTAFQQYTLKALKYEVFDYVMKPIDVDELKETLARLEKYLNSSQAGIDQVMQLLSGREKQVFRLVVDGHTSEEIAACLFISVNTVNTHRRNILKKSGARNTAELLRPGRAH
jgi:two-component system LytT family response regulator